MFTWIVPLAIVYALNQKISLTYSVWGQFYKWFINVLCVKMKMTYLPSQLVPIPTGMCSLLLSCLVILFTSNIQDREALEQGGKELFPNWFFSVRATIFAGSLRACPQNCVYIKMKIFIFFNVSLTKKAYWKSVILIYLLAILEKRTELGERGEGKVSLSL